MMKYFHFLEECSSELSIMSGWIERRLFLYSDLTTVTWEASQRLVVVQGNEDAVDQTDWIPKSGSALTFCYIAATAVKWFCRLFNSLCADVRFNLINIVV